MVSHMKVFGEDGKVDVEVVVVETEEEDVGPRVEDDEVAIDEELVGVDIEDVLCEIELLETLELLMVVIIEVELLLVAA